MDRISLSAGFVDILKVYSPKSKIIEQLHQDMDINKFKEFLGLVKKNATEEDGVAKNNQLEAADLSVIIEALIKEMSIGNNSEIKCIIHNFIKATTQRDPKFQQRVASAEIDCRQLPRSVRSEHRHSEAYSDRQRRADIRRPPACRRAVQSTDLDPRAARCVQTLARSRPAQKLFPAGCSSHQQVRRLHPPP